MDDSDLPHRLYAAYNRHDPAAVADLYSATGTHEDIADGRARCGPEAIAAGLRRFFTWFPDAHWENEFQISDASGRPGCGAMPRRSTAARLQYATSAGGVAT